MKSLKQYYSQWKLQKPFAATAAGWREWKESAKKNFPIRYFIQETLPHRFDEYIWWPIKRKFDSIYYWFYYRFTPQGRKLYIIRPRTLEPGFYDYLNLILHGNFEILVQFVEEDKRWPHVDWTHDARHRKLKAEVDALYHWWTKVYPNREKKLPKYPKTPKRFKDQILVVLDEKYKNDPYVKEHNRIGRIRMKMEDEFVAEEQKMLQRLIKIRMSLWL